MFDLIEQDINENFKYLEKDVLEKYDVIPGTWYIYRYYAKLANNEGIVIDVLPIDEWNKNKDEILKAQREWR